MATMRHELIAAGDFAEGAARSEHRAFDDLG